MKHPLEEQIEALKRLTAKRESIPAKRQRGYVKKVRKPKPETPQLPPYEMTPTSAAKRKIERVDRKCLRCGREFEALGRFERLCSRHCKDDNVGMGPDGGTGRRIEGKL